MIKSPIMASASRLRRFLTALIAGVIILGLLQGCETRPPVAPEVVVTPDTAINNPEDFSDELNNIVEYDSDSGTNGGVKEQTDNVIDDSDQESSQEYTIGVLVGDNFSEYVSLLLASADKHPDVSLKIYTATDQTIQNNQLENLIQQKVNSLIVAMVDISSAQSFIDMIASAELPVIFLGDEPEEAIIKRHDRARFVGTAASEPGIEQGGVIIELWKTNLFDSNNDGVMQYVIIKGDINSPESLVISEYSIKTVEDSGIKTAALDSQYCDWDVSKANATMVSWIERFGDEIEFVIANSDDMALGAIEALQSAGYNNGDRFIPVVGIGASKEALTQIEKGIMSGTVGPDSDMATKVAFAAAYNAAQGKKFLSGTSYSYDSSNVAVRISYLSYIHE